MLLSIIIVNYNSGEMLHNCLKSIYDSGVSFEHEIIVIDNSSADDSLKKAQADFPNVIYIRNNENAGFAKANNQGIRMAKGAYILIQNPDTLVVGQSIESLVNYARANPDVGIAGGRLLNEDGTLQYSIQRFPAVASQVFEAFFIHKLLPQLTRNFGEAVLNDAAYNKSLDVDWIFGAVMLINKKAISKVGMLDESFFLYSEEVDWCYRMKSNGWRVAYYPEATFVHFMGKASTNLQLYIQRLRARRQFGYKHFHPLKARLLDLTILVYLLNRTLLFMTLSIVKPSEDTKQMRELYSKSGKALLGMIIRNADMSNYATLQRNGS